jgi:hypothetical protein
LGISTSGECAAGILFTTWTDRKITARGAHGSARLKREWNLQFVNTLERFSSGIAPREILTLSLMECQAPNENIT